MHPEGGMQKTTMRVVWSFVPGKRFPAISVTGSRCALDCPHCAGRPLEGMIAAETPERLIEIASELKRKGCIGFLLSGGCDPSGVLPLAPYLPAIRSIRSMYGLRINAHVGYPRAEDAEALVESGIDSFSLSFPISDAFGLRVMRIRNAVDRYFETYDSLRERGARRVVPHVLIGLASAEEEAQGLELLRANPPNYLVVISFLPFRRTPMHGEKPANKDSIIRFIKMARAVLPNTGIVLGCMRKRGDSQMESMLMRTLVDGIVMPDKRALAEVSRSIIIQELEGCCALYL